MALIWLLRRKLGAEDHAVHALPAGAARVSGARAVLLGLRFAALMVAALCVGRMQSGWALSIDPLILSLRCGSRLRRVPGRAWLWRGVFCSV
ncbi:hypothetical protein [Cypionkella psychrotolerans]|uniref:hypothetical protein n=1 Tax=Cypionkella psychrotolerans TaxID=1678131 RepID=UPI0006B4165B|nr:hypothetical protein [Cypionkella psychrotolerans]